MREHHKAVNTQKRYDAQLKAAQQSAGQQIHRRCDKNLANLDAKVKGILKETVKSQSIKKEAIMFDSSLIECQLVSEAFDARPSSQSSSKRFRQSDTIDVRSPSNQRNTKKQDLRKDSSRQHYSNERSKGYSLSSSKYFFKKKELL